MLGMGPLLLRDSRPKQEDLSVTIGLEHGTGMALALTVTNGSGGAIIDIGHDAVTLIAVSVPTTWTRTEVRGVPLSSVTSQEAALGFTRWTLPAGASVTYRSNERIGEVILRSGSNTPFQVKLTTVEGRTGQALHDVFLAGSEPLTLPIHR
jgi:hypothetical protein